MTVGGGQLGAVKPLDKLHGPSFIKLALLQGTVNGAYRVGQL